MKDLRLLFICSTLFLLATFATAWPWPELDSLIQRRQDGNQGSSSGAQQTPSPSASQTNSGSQSTITDKPSGSGSNSASETGSRSGSNSGSFTGSSIKGNFTTTRSGNKTHASVIDPRLPAGGVQMTAPPIISGPQYYKIGDFVSFGWNYTSLSVSPTAVDIMASCSKNNQVYTLAVNQSIAESSIMWDTGNYQATATIPLLTETYTLVIYDAAGDTSATAQAGYLAVFNQYTFGMYTPQAYTPLGQYICATCSAGLSISERQALSFMVGMGVITVLSFTWFVQGFGIRL